MRAWNYRSHSKGVKFFLCSGVEISGLRALVRFKCILSASTHPADPDALHRSANNATCSAPLLRLHFLHPQTGGQTLRESLFQRPVSSLFTHFAEDAVAREDEWHLIARVPTLDENLEKKINTHLKILNYSYILGVFAAYYFLVPPPSSWNQKTNVTWNGTDGSVCWRAGNWADSEKQRAA